MASGKRAVTSAEHSLPHFRKAAPPAAGDSLFKEARGLECLRSALQRCDSGELRVPEVFSVSATALEMQRIHSRPASSRQMRALGRGLAAMHALPQPHYGFGEDNFIGLSPQPNRLCDNWGEFFTDHRLGFQLRRIHSAVVRSEFASALQRSRRQLIDFLNTHCAHPSLLHGDLWSGNVLFDERGAWLIDPAVYCGDREADLAMTEMFGGFSAEFYRAYDEVCARSEVYPLKRDIYNLYHYLNHYNLFGDGYLAACRRGIAQLQALPG